MSKFVQIQFEENAKLHNKIWIKFNKTFQIFKSLDLNCECVKFKTNQMDFITVYLLQAFMNQSSQHVQESDEHI